MNVLILNTQIPYCYGGAEVLAEDLETQLNRLGHNAAILTVPFKWYPQQALVNSMLISKLMDISDFNGMKIDKVIALKFPLWLIPHPDMSLWILHQHRTVYDLWDSEFSDVAAMPDGPTVRDMIRREDTEAIAACKRVFTISRNVSARLKKYNALDSGVLYPPPRDMEKFSLDGYENFLFFPSRISPIKRQNLVIKALAHTSDDVRVLIAGEPDNPAYMEELKKLAARHKVSHKITWLGRISERDKFDYYARALAVIFPPVDEDYGYISPEAMLSSKAVITLADSGGATEFVKDGETGLIASPEAASLGEAIEKLWSNRTLAKSLGGNARQYLREMDLSWEKIESSLL